MPMRELLKHVGRWLEIFKASPLSERSLKTVMVKVVSCKDMGVDCPFEARADSVETAVQKFVEHAEKHHGARPTSDFIEMVKSRVKNI